MSALSTKIYAHRGAKGDYPENTLLAFKKAIECGADGIELDIHMTKDGHIVVIHDETVDRTTDGTGHVKDMRLGEIKHLSAGNQFTHMPKYHKSWDYEQVPTLEEVMRLIKDYNRPIELNIEIKADIESYKGIEDRLITLIDQYEMRDSVIISSFNIDLLKKVRRKDKDIKLAALTINPFKNEVEFFNEDGLDAFHYPFNWLFENTLMTKMGFDNIRVWTVNERDDISELIKLKVKAIITDFPEIALELRDRAKEILKSEPSKEE